MKRILLITLLVIFGVATARGQVIVTPVAGVATVDVSTCGQGGVNPNPTCSFKLTLTANTTLALINATNGATTKLFINPSTFTLTWPANVSSPPTLTASANNSITLQYDGTIALWYPSGGGSSSGVTITTVSGLASISGKTKGTIATVTDGNSATDCTVGGGTNVVDCQYSGSTWAQLVAASSGSTAFSAITGSTNSTAAMVVGTGASISPSGTGTVNANQVNGAALPASKTIVGTNSSNQIVDASAAPLTNNTTGTAANVTGIVAPANGGCGVASPTAHTISVNEGASNCALLRTDTALTGQLVQANNAADPTAISPGVPDGNSKTHVTTTPYLIACDSATALLDRATTIVFDGGASVVTAPDHTASGCGANLVFTLINESGGTLTINRSGSDTFNVTGSISKSIGATSFTIPDSGNATLNNGETTIWNARVLQPGGTPCTVTALSFQYNNAGAFGCISNLIWTTASGLSTSTQLANSNDTWLFKRFTDTSPTGTFHKYQNAAGGALGQFDVSANWAILGSLSTGSATNLTTCAGASASCIGVTEGTAPTDTTASVDRIYPDSTQQTVELQVHNADFNGAVGVRCTNVTPVTANTSTTADQNLMACSLKANTLNNTLRSFRVWDGSLYTTPAASVATINTKVKLCTVSGCGSGTVLTLYTVTSSANPGTVTNNSVNNTVLCTVQTAGATASFECHGNMVIDLGASPGLADSTFSDNNTATIGTIDTTAALFIQVTRAFSVASGSNSTSERQLIVEILN